MIKKYKYDIAFSVAEEDLPVAWLVAAALREKNISYYLYTEHRAANLGKSILEITGEIYAGMAKYVLMITSSTFVNKYWAGIESQFASFHGRKKDAYVLQLRLDDTQLDGLSRHIVFEKWRDNPSEIAAVIAQKMVLKQNKLSAQKFRVIAAGVVFFTMITGFIVWKGIGKKGAGAISVTVTDTIPAKPVLPEDTAGKHKGLYEADSLQPVVYPADSSNKVVEITHTDNARDSIVQDSSSTVPQPVAEDPAGLYDYCVIVEGGDESLNEQIAYNVNKYLLSKKVSTTENKRKARNIIRIDLSVKTSPGGEDGVDYTYCHFGLSIINEKGQEVLVKTGDTGNSEAAKTIDVSDLLMRELKGAIDWYFDQMQGTALKQTM
jgi:hypothetical protein